MKYLRQLTVILVISFLGEVLHYLLPFPIPASVYGLVLMLLCLETGIVHLGEVKETSAFLTAVMPVMFVPAGVGLMTSITEMKGILIPVVVIIVLTTVAVMVVTGKMSQMIIKKERHIMKRKKAQLCQN